jgi:hypothetical protein
MVAHGLKRGFAPFEKTLLATAWLVPLLARIVTKLSYMPIGPMIMLLLFGAILIRALNETWASRTLSAPLAVRP